MKKIKVSIRDEQTLELQEDGQKGDLIDLSSLHDLDIDKSTIKSVVNSIKKDHFDEEVEKVRKTVEQQKELEAQLKEQKLLEKIAVLEKEKESAVKLAEANAKNLSQEDIAKKEAEITRLQSQIEAAQTEKKLAVTEALKVVEKERDELVHKLDKKDSESKLLTTSIKEKYENELKSKEEMIEYYKDLKVKASTKMLGETLEQHCEIEFNKLRATAFQNAYFEKDNEGNAKGSTKGDYIYRETNDQGVEIISIMFEMKNEGDDTENKKKNEDFFKKLDKDRNDKGCEYAVLVSLLEADNELYNTGIVDVSHKYPKMYVIRPQFFIPMITLLRNAALNSLKYKTELAIVKSQNIDITKFEDEVTGWKDSWLRSMKYAGQQHVEAVEQINKAIKDLEKVRDALTLSDKHLLTAENKMDDLTIKRLTRGNPTMKEKFEELKKDK
ncbi:MAG: DUF2130 domain-containing protein [Candidatus Pacebacteria bacterium CG10_big_fil_rev_8_21_14_0_10_42_12]|nr:MAG: DUF2130 domain-containing protein [Candidatus Pacebacteria bacterium CG10_big_fil_rev_8_21_14_0_10_42_12]